MGNWFSQSVNCFHGRGLPEPAVPAGYAALIERFDLAVPLPPRLTAIAERHHPAPNPSWHLLTPRHRPGFLAQGRGHLSKRARENEFRSLTDEETTRVEALYSELFGDFGREAV
jgi:hypothetical protein